MSEVNKIIDRLTQLDEALSTIKEQKKQIDEEIKSKEEELIEFCESKKEDIGTITEGKYQMKPATGRRLKKS